MAEQRKWAFAARFRTNAYSWKGTQLASQRLKEALSEIKKTGKKEPVLAANGAILLIEKLVASIANIDSSSGAIGTAANRTLDSLIDIIIAAPADESTVAKWLERLWQAYEEDGYGYLSGLAGRWGELCRTPELASKQADTFIWIVRRCWAESADRSRYGYYNGTEACLSCLLAAGRYQELLDLLALRDKQLYTYCEYGVRAMVAMGMHEEAISYALASGGMNESPIRVAADCEQVLLDAGRVEEAYERFAFTANLSTTNLATYRAIKKKYPHKPPQIILTDLIANSPGQEGKWFATAKDLELFDLAVQLVSMSPCDPFTLNRAARDFIEKSPNFALGAALASLHWIAQGHGYDITSLEVKEAVAYAKRAAGMLAVQKETRTRIEASTRVNSQVHEWALRYIGDWGVD